MKIISAEYVASIASANDYFESDKPEFLLLGRSNVGKSSFINMILNRKRIAYTSSKPGKTQTLNFYNINDTFHIVDAPGYGYAKVNKTVREKFGVMIEEYLTQRENLKNVFLLIDVRHDPTKDDVLMFDFLKYYDIPTVIVATKSDKVPKNKLRANKQKLINQFKCEVVCVSSLDNIGAEEIHAIIDKNI